MSNKLALGYLKVGDYFIYDGKLVTNGTNRDYR